MRRAIVLTFATLLLPPGTASSPSAPMTEDEAAVKKELELLQGQWEMVGREYRGKKSTAEELKQLKGILVVEGTKLTGWSDEMGKKANGQESTIKIDPAPKPKAIDKTIAKGIGKGETMVGIYKLDGDHLTVCLAVGTKERPTE